MPKENYEISNNPDQATLENELRVILQRIALRLDQMEGDLGTATISSKLQILDGDGNILHAFNVSQK